MPRIRIDLPETFPFATEIPVRITDLNYGRHLGNDAMLSLLHEARVQFLARYGYREDDVEGHGLLMADAAVAYKREAFYGDRLRIEVAVADLQRSGFDLVYRVTKVGAGDVVAEAKTGMVFFDSTERKVRRAPPGFAARFGTTAAPNHPA